MQSSIRTLGSLALALSALLSGCDRRTEPFPATPVPPPENPVLIPDLQAMDTSTLPTPLGQGQGAGERNAPSRAAGTAADGPPIRGVIRLAEGTLEPSQGVIFVILRKPEMRPPLAALRLPPGPFPLEFEIGPDDRAQMGGAPIPFAGPMELTVRSDLDLNPMTRSPGELEGSGGTVQPGAEGVEIILGATQG